MRSSTEDQETNPLISSCSWWRAARELKKMITVSALTSPTSPSLGVAETTGVYDIPCLTEQGILPEKSDPVTAYALAKAVYWELLQVDRAHLPKKKLGDRVSFFLSWLMCSIGSFFALIAYFFSKMGRKNKRKL